MSQNKTGKYIHELNALIGSLKNEACFAVSQDNLTRRVYLSELRSFINGDNNPPSTDSYYSSAKIKEIVDATNNTLIEMKGSITNIETSLSQTQQTIRQNFNSLTEMINLYKEHTNEKITEMDGVIKVLNNQVGGLGEAVETINNNITELNNSIGNITGVLENHNNTIVLLVERLNNLQAKVGGMIKFGTDVPTASNISDKGIYVQIIE